MTRTLSIGSHPLLDAAEMVRGGLLNKPDPKQQLELQTLRGEVQALTEHLGRVKQRNTELQTQLGEAQKKNTELNTQLAQAQDQNELFGTRHEALIAELAETKGKKIEAESKIADLTRQLEAEEVGHRRTIQSLTDAERNAHMATKALDLAHAETGRKDNTISDLRREIEQLNTNRSSAEIALVKLSVIMRDLKFRKLKRISLVLSEHKLVPIWNWFAPFVTMGHRISNWIPWMRR